MTRELSEPVATLSFAGGDFDPAKYEDVARRARVREVRLVASTYTAKVTRFLAADHGDGVEMKQSYVGEPAQYSFSPERGVLAGSYHWTAEVKVGRLKVLKLGTEYLVVYSNLKDAEGDYVRRYFNKLARFTTYPYFRAHFAMSASASGVMLAPLPSLIDRVD